VALERIQANTLGAGNNNGVVSFGSLQSFLADQPSSFQAGFSALSLLPAVLLHLSLGPARPALWIAGYVVSGLAMVLHVGDALTASPRFHYAGLLLITIGFAC
jgi:hypothetical protein